MKLNVRAGRSTFVVAAAATLGLVLAACGSGSTAVPPQRNGSTDVAFNTCASVACTGTIAGAALDVVTTEPIPADNPLLKAPNLTLTPHIAWAALEARRRLTKVTVENVAAFQAGKPINLVN